MISIYELYTSNISNVLTVIVKISRTTSLKS